VIDSVDLKIPAFFLSARDDPICSAEAIPFQLCSDHNYTGLIVTSRDAHSFVYFFFVEVGAWKFSNL
jgi:predicted alpha/beta-fold hydrolase